MVNLAVLVVSFCASRTGSVPCDRAGWEGSAKQTSKCVSTRQTSSRGGGYNLTRFGSPEHGISVRKL